MIFAKGFFNETMRPLRSMVDKLAIMRLDGDMYESTVDVLYHLYDKLSVGGYVIIDDWEDGSVEGFPAKRACLHFFAAHSFQPTVVRVDGMGAYWKKTQEIEIEYWRYETNDFRPKDFDRAAKNRQQLKLGMGA